MLNAINNTQEATVTQVATVKSITAVNQYLKAKKIRNAKLSKRKEILLQNKAEKKAFQSRLEVPTHTTTQGVDQMNINLIKKIKQATSLAEITVISQELSHKSKKVANAIANAIAALSAPATLLVRRTAVSPAIPKSEWLSTIEAQKNAAKRRALKLAAKAEAKAKAEVKAAAKAEAKVSNAEAKAKAKAVAKASKTDLFCPGALIALIKAFGSISIELLDYSKESFKKYTTKSTTTKGSQITVVATQSQLKQGDNRNMRSTVPSISIKNTFLTQVGFKSSEEIKDWFKEDAESISGIEFNGQKIAIQVTSLDQPGKVNVDSRVIQLNDKLNYHQRVFALVHELDHLHYNDLKATGSSDQLKLLKSIQECKSQPNHPAFLDEEHGEEELWVRHRDYLREDETFKDFFEWYEKSEVSTTSQPQEQKKVKTSTSKTTKNKAVAAERLAEADLVSLIPEIVFLKSSTGLKVLADHNSTWASPLNQTKKVLGLKESQFVKVSFKDLNFKEMIRIQKALNKAGWYFVSQNMIAKKSDAETVFANAKKVFKNLTGFVNYGKAWFTTPCKPAADYIVGLINEEELAGLTGNDGAGFMTTGVHYSLMQFRVTGFDNGLFGKGILTHTKFIIEDDKVVNVDELSFNNPKDQNDFQSWLSNPNSNHCIINSKTYKKAVMLCSSNLKGKPQNIPVGNEFKEIKADLFSLMAGDLGLKPGSLTMPNQISFYSQLDPNLIEELVEKSFKKNNTNLKKFVLLNNLTNEVISLANSKFKTKYVQMSDLNTAVETELDQQKVIDLSVNFVLDSSEFEEDQLKKDVWMVRTPVQDQNALNAIPSYNTTIVHDILSLSEEDLFKKYPSLDSSEVEKIKKVFNDEKKILQFKAIIAPVVKQGIMWLDARVQEILVGDNDGDMNSYRVRGENLVIDDLFSKSAAYKNKDIIKKETSKAFVLDSSSNDDWTSDLCQQRIITPNGGQLNVGAISNLQVAVRSQLGFHKLPDVVTFAGRTISGIQQPSIDRQKYKYVLPSLNHWNRLRGPIEITLDGKTKNLIIPGVSWIAKGMSDFKDFNENKDWTTEELSLWFKESFKDYDDFSEEEIVNLNGESVNAYDPEGYNSLGCQTWGQKFILAVKLASLESDLANQPLLTQIDRVQEIMLDLESGLKIADDDLAAAGISKEELKDPFYSLKWLKEIQHQSCPVSLSKLRDKFLESLILEDLLVGIVSDYQQVYDKGVVNTHLSLDTSDDSSVVDFGKMLSKLFASQKHQMNLMLENTNRSSQKQQELSTLGSWVAAANDVGLDWLVNILANNKLESEKRKIRLSDFKRALAWVIVDQVILAFDINSKTFKTDKNNLIEFLGNIVSLLNAIDEAENNTNSVQWTNQLIVEAGINFKKGIEAKTESLEDLICRFETEIKEKLVGFIRDNHFGGDENKSTLQIINSHVWNKYAFVLNIAKRPSKAFELYKGYGWDEEDFKGELTNLVLKEVGRKDNKKLIVPTKVTYLLSNKWWGDMVRGLTKSETVSLYYRTLCDTNGDVGYVVADQTQKAWLTFTSKHADKFEVLAPYGLSEVISSTQLENLLIDNEQLGVNIEDDESVSQARKLLGNFGEYKELKASVKEIVKESLVIKGSVKTSDHFEDAFVATPYGYLTVNVNHKMYSSNFRNAMHLLYGIQKVSLNQIAEAIYVGDFDGAFDLMYPLDIKKGVLRDFRIDLSGFKTRDEMLGYDKAKAESEKVSKQKGPKIIKKQKMTAIWDDFRSQQQNLAYKGMKQTEINLDAPLVYLNNQSPIGLVKSIGNKDDYRARLLLLNRDMMLARNIETMHNVAMQLANNSGDAEQLQQIYDNCKNSILREVTNPVLKKIFYSAINDVSKNLELIVDVESDELIDTILK